MLKKILSILLLMSMCSSMLLLTGCSKDFEKVHSVTYTMDGKTYTVNLVATENVSYVGRKNIFTKLLNKISSN